MEKRADIAILRRLMRHKAKVEVVQGLAEFQAMGLLKPATRGQWQACVVCRQRFQRVYPVAGTFANRCLECHGTPAPTVNGQGRFILQTEGRTA